MESTTTSSTLRMLALITIGSSLAFACTASEKSADCFAQQQALRTRQQILEARIERLELQLAAVQVRPNGSIPERVPTRVSEDPFALALAMIDEPPMLERADALLTLVEQNPTHPRASEALLLSAQALMRAEEWALADWTFEKVIHGWPHASEALQALWGRAQLAWARERPEEARRHLELLAAHREGGLLARQAQEELEKIGQERDDDPKRQ